MRSGATKESEKWRRASRTGPDSSKGGTEAGPQYYVMPIEVVFEGAVHHVRRSEGRLALSSSGSYSVLEPGQSNDAEGL